VVRNLWAQGEAPQAGRAAYLVNLVDISIHTGMLETTEPGSPTTSSHPSTWLSPQKWQKSQGPSPRRIWSSSQSRRWLIGDHLGSPITNKQHDVHDLVIDCGHFRSFLSAAKPVNQHWVKWVTYDTANLGPGPGLHPDQDTRSRHVVQVLKGGHFRSATTMTSIYILFDLSFIQSRS